MKKGRVKIGIFNVLLLQFLFFYPPLAFSAESCVQLLSAPRSVQNSSLFSESFDLIRIPSDELKILPTFKKSTKALLDIITFKKTRKTISFKEIGTIDDIYLGFLENGHVYLVINGERLDGEALYLSPRFRKSGFLTEGFVVKFKAQNNKVSRTLSEFIEADGRPRSLICASGICSALSNTLRLIDQQNGQDVSTLFPSKLFEKIIKKQLELESGAEPIFEVYLLGDEEPEELLRSIKKSEITRPAPFVLGAAMLSLMTLYFSF